MRLSSVKGTAINAATDMVVSSREGIYDDGGSWQEVGNSGYMVQKLGEQNPELISYINEKIQIYSWVDNGPKLVMPDWSLAQAVHGRDRLTGYALDENGGYRTSEIVGDSVYNPRFYPCATIDCVATRANMDLEDSFTQAWLQALDAEAARKTSYALGAGAIISSGVVVGVLTAGSSAASLTAGYIEGELPEALAHEAMGMGVEKYSVLRGATDEIAQKVSTIAGLSGAWDSVLENLRNFFND